MKLSVTGCLVFESKHFKDDRGYFIEAYKESSYRDLISPVVQTNVSVSHKNVVRGLHIQWPMQGKLVRVLHGVALDVVVDVRPGANYGKVESFLLKPEGISVLIPAGFLHGFWALTDDCVFHYGCTTEYSKNEGGVNPTDPDLFLPWRNNSEIIISDKDKKLPMLKEFKGIM